MVCVDSYLSSTGEVTLDRPWQVPLQAVRSVELKSMPLVLTIEFEGVSGGGRSREAALQQLVSDDVAFAAPSMATPASMAPKSENNNSSGGGVVAKSVTSYKQILGDWQKDGTALMRMYNLLNCLLGRFEM